MTSGLPDYYLGMRPRYGAAKHNSGTKLVLARDVTELCSIDGKGMIYGGHLWFIHIPTQKNSAPFLKIDGITLMQPTFYDLCRFNLTRDRVASWYLRVFNETIHRYSVGLSSGFTFESNFTITYNEVHNTRPQVYWQVFYALIT